MLDFINKACFAKTGEYKKLFILFLVDTWVDRLAPSLAGLTFFILLSSSNVPRKTFYIISAALAIQFFLVFIIKTKLYIFNFKTLAESIRDFQIILGEKLRRLPMGFYQSKKSSDLLKIIVDDHNTVNMTWTGIIQVMASGIVNLIILVILLPFLDLKMSLVFISLIPISYLFVYISAKKYKKVSEALRKTKVESSNTLLDYISGLSSLRLFGIKGEKFEKLSSSLKKIKDLTLKMEMSSFPIATFSTSILFMGTGIIAYFGAILIKNGSLNPIIYVVFLFVSMQIYTPLIILYLNTLILSDFKSAVGRIYDFYEYDELKSGNAKTKSEEKLSFRDLNFSYGENPVLKGINLSIEKNKIYAIVGKSGCGKTTLLKMLLRYYEPNNEDIFLGDEAINNFEIENYLSRYGVVFQNAYMFNKSVAYNIGIAKNDATKEEIIEAAKLANCHEFIEKLENGYDSVIGVSGSKLSAGQRQRIAVARAFLKDANTILLDEPTASLDIENEVLLKLALQKLSEHKTVIVVSHRLNFIKDADKIIVMENGRISAVDNHETLIKENAVYQKLWQDEESVLSWHLK